MSQNPLEITVANFSNQFKLMTYNVDQAMREEQYENTRWINRKDRIIKLISEVDADIVCLQEMRQLPDSISVNQFLASFEKYYCEVSYRNPSPMSFGNAILYNPSKFYPICSMKRWLSTTPELPSDDFSSKPAGSCGWGYILFGMKFVPVCNGKVITNAKPFWIFNTHFPLEECVKTKLAVVIKDIIKKEIADEDFILCGDFNFFPDRDGDKQRELILTHDYNIKDLGKGAKTLSGKYVEGTFVGYDHDEFKADLVNMISRLDHIFGSHNVSGKNCLLYAKTMFDTEPPELTTRNFPSDHLPLVIDITIN
jgi:endonuclease/exonuclease/phosphatase family metal-dependent hydrolase